jgi:hypothetical protein
MSTSGQKLRPFSAKIYRKDPVPYRKDLPTSSEGPRQPRKDANVAAQQLWYEWSQENLENMSKAAQRRRLGPDAQRAIINEEDTQRLVKV